MSRKVYGTNCVSNIYPEYGSKPKELRDMLAVNRIEMTAFSSGGVQFNSTAPDFDCEAYETRAKPIKDAGGRYLLNHRWSRRKQRRRLPTTTRWFGKMATEIVANARLDLGAARLSQPHEQSRRDARRCRADDERI